jgi:transcription elongation factor GreB
VSKAFTRESDDAPQEEVVPPLRSILPPGAKNYLTPDGAQRLRADLEKLVQQRAGNSVNKSSRDQRILRLQESLQSGVVVEPPPPPWEQVRFGATVTVRHLNGETSDYRIVGVDETDTDRGWVSFLSPIAKALLNARLGEKVRFKIPSGEEQLVIIGIRFG